MRRPCPKLGPALDKLAFDMERRICKKRLHRADVNGGNLATGRPCLTQFNQKGRGQGPVHHKAGGYPPTAFVYSAS